MFALTGVKTRKVSAVTESPGRNDSSDAMHLHYGFNIQLRLSWFMAALGNCPWERSFNDLD